MNKWTDAKYLLGCALFIDLLTPCAIFSKTTQVDDLDILRSLSYLLRTVKETNKLNGKQLDQWTTYAATLKKISENEGGKLYQGQGLRNFPQAKNYFEKNYQDCCTRVTACIRTRLAWSDLQLFCDIIVVLATQGWQKIVDDGNNDMFVEGVEVADSADENSLNTIDRLVEHFKVPLDEEAAAEEEEEMEEEQMLLDD